MVMGSAWLASLFAHAVFWPLLVYGWFSEDLGVRGAVVFVLAWLAGFLLLPFAPYGDALFAPFVAILDIVLVLIIFQGDVRL